MIQVTFSINLVFLHSMKIAKYDFFFASNKFKRNMTPTMLYCVTNIYICPCIHIGIYICQGIIIMHYDIVHRNCVSATGRAYKFANMHYKLNSESNAKYRTCVREMYFLIKLN